MDASSEGGKMEPAVLDEIQRIFRAARFIADLGIELDSVGDGECVTTLELENRHLQQDGYVHAGVHATIADHTAGVAAATMLRKNQMVLTVEFKINLLRAARGERLICRAEVLKPGRRFSVVESEVFCISAEGEHLVSKITATMANVDV
jgi:uncharacterized protein (TIGR00369 family)